MDKRDVREMARARDRSIVSRCGGEGEATARSTDLHRAFLGDY
jgi:hypothetical protein